jgi:C4-dicarboxylate-specific signal transduction histidine kinase
VDWRRERNAQLEVWGDRDLLEQVYGNLMSNALQALEGLVGAKITWSLGNTESGKAWIRIEDNGPGVSDEVLPKLFTPFVTSKAQGTGLGLSFVKKVIEDQGGAVEYLSGERLNGRAGACFAITLPLHQSAASEVAPSQTIPADGRLNA